jgi:hypothetical protein
MPPAFSLVAGTLRDLVRSTPTLVAEHALLAAVAVAVAATTEDRKHYVWYLAMHRTLCTAYDSGCVYLMTSSRRVMGGGFHHVRQV